ncbi:S-layer homology domain-containing protein [Paenibacillus sacheonensis]|uniref:S-layer homology domain-containing protein n=1 Tax=Paenibacillus sacheonensis TaxID=742054 RepID=UPI0019564B25|nr:S-layer homology domain-containing protein [Paenibacillus sacheonensis]MBM7565309.1 hypothetical protein [Paenibacillus sacheonensis]
MKTLKWTGALLLGLTVGASFAAEASAKTSADFTDLKDLDAATKAKFDAMINAGIFDGVSDTTFGLKDEMNRAQFAKVAALITGLEVNKDLKTSSFTDVKADDIANGYALPYIEALKAAGITDGYGEGTYNPAGKVTKEQLATFLVRTLGMDKDAKSTAPVNDQSVSDWAKGYVALALDLKLMGGGTDGTFGGKSNATRDLLVTGSYESAQTLEVKKPLAVSGAEFAAGNKLELTSTTALDESSIDLSKITVNGVALDPKKDSFKLSDDKKTIIITLHDGFTLDNTKTPVIEATGLKSLYGNEIKKDADKPVPVKVTEAPPAPPAPPVNTGSNSNTNTPPPSSNTPTLTIDKEHAVASATGVTFNVTTNLSKSSDTVYYAIVPGAAKDVDAAELVPPVSLSDYVQSGSQSYTEPTMEIEIGDNYDMYLDPSTEYTIYMIARSEGMNSAVASYTFTTEEGLPDIPSLIALTSGTSRESGEETDSIHLALDVQHANKVYYVLLPQGQNPLTTDEIKNFSNDAYSHGEVQVTNRAVDISLEGLLKDSTYILYTVGSNAEYDSESAPYTFYRTDGILTFEEFSYADGQLTPNYDSADYQFYYWTLNDVSDGAIAPSADYVISKSMPHFIDESHPSVTISGVTGPTRVYGVIVEDVQRSNVVSIDIDGNVGGGPWQGGEIPTPFLP